jgi:hypothetical protein
MVRYMVIRYIGGQGIGDGGQETGDRRRRAEDGGKMCIAKLTYILYLPPLPSGDQSTSDTVLLISSQKVPISTQVIVIIYVCMYVYIYKYS